MKLKRNVVHGASCADARSPRCYAAALSRSTEPRER